MTEEPEEGEVIELVKEDMERVKELMQPILNSFEEEGLDDLSCAITLLEIVLEAMTIMGGTMFTLKMLGSTIVDVTERGEEFERIVAAKHGAKVH